jgi:tetratricopeptide (TPR) repeat protein
MAEDIEFIKWMLYGIYLILFFFGCVIFLNYRLSKNRISSMMREDFMSEAQKLQDKGLHSELQELSEERINENHHDSSAHFYLGMSYYKRKQYGAALQAFTEIQSIDPAWEKFMVQDYIDEIKLNMKGPKGTASSESNITDL